MQQCTCMWYQNTGQKPSPDIEWLKHSSRHKPSPLWTTRCSKTWVLPHWTTSRSRAKALTALNNKVFQDMSPPALNDKTFQGKSPPAFMLMQWTPLVYINIQLNYNTPTTWTTTATTQQCIYINMTYTPNNSTSDTSTFEMKFNNMYNLFINKYT